MNHVLLAWNACFQFLADMLSDFPASICQWMRKTNETHVEAIVSEGFKEIEINEI